jgi:ParB/RepB/Spo0J family partition protein
MPASRQSRYKERYDKLLGESLAIVQSTQFSADELSQAAEDALKRVPGAVLVPIEKIEPNPENPRHGMDEVAMRTLADSIAERGLLQPLVIRRNPDRVGTFVVIAGSRRLLAARLVQADPDESVRARVALVPCIIKEASATDAFADALLENLARADLSRAETMDALLRLHRDFGWSGKYIAQRTGRSQGDISELLRIVGDGDLAELVRSDALKPSTATIIKRMPQDLRRDTIAQVRAGETVTVEEALRRLRAGRVHPEPPSTPASGAALDGVSNSIPPVTSGASRPSASERPAPGVSNSIASAREDAAGDGLPAQPPDLPAFAAKAAVHADLGAGIRDQLEAIGTLVAQIDESALAGAAVLAAVKHDLNVAYERLAAYLKRPPVVEG